MKRTSMLLSVVVVVGVGQAALGQQVVSWQVLLNSADVLNAVTSDVGSSGVVITDVMSNNTNAHEVLLYSTTSLPGEQPEAVFRFEGEAATHSVHMNSGVYFEPGEPLSVMMSGAPGGDRITLSGYIPGTASAGVPTLSDTGVFIMMLFIVAVGGFVFRRTKLQVE